MIDYVCPICKSVLKKGSDYACGNGHRFDLAKEGYVNLLLPNQKKKNDPGDNKEMVLSRDVFLEQGYFEELVSVLQRKAEGVILDVGCGTGYYTKHYEGERYGIDISKHAVRIAAKKDKEGHYAVASAFSLPFENQAFDCLFNVFAPKAGKEYARVLKEDGKLIEVIPGAKHMLELKQLLYDKVYLNEEKAGIEGFTLVSTEEVCYQREVKDIMSLFSMTPYRYKTNEKSIERISSLSMLSVTFDFIVRVYQLKR